MQKVLVTGANGFLGYYLVEQLLQKKYSVIATGKGLCRLPFQATHFVYQSMDLCNEQDVHEKLEQHRPDIIVHCGAMSKPDECELNRDAALQINVRGTEYLLKHALPIQSRFIFLSTDFVFDGMKGLYVETDEIGPVNFYGITKLQAEHAVRNYPGPWSIVRTVMVYGKPFLNRQNIVTSSASALKKGERLNIFDDQVRTPTYVEDLAQAILLIMEKKAIGIYHISGDEVMTPYQMVVAVANLLQLDESLIGRVTEKELDQPARRPMKTGFNITKARRELGFKPIAFKMGLQKTFTNE